MIDELTAQAGGDEAELVRLVMEELGLDEARAEELIALSRGTGGRDNLIED
jgi:hypothetical protein